jgi:hypothetical protein
VPDATRIAEAISEKLGYRPGSEETPRQLSGRR